MFVYEKWSISWRLDCCPGCSPLPAWKGRRVSPASECYSQGNQQLGFYFVPILSITPCRSCDYLGKSGSWLLFPCGPVVWGQYTQLDILLWNHFPKRHYPGTSLDHSLANSQQPSSWACPDPGRGRKPVTGMQKKLQQPFAAFLEPSPYLSVCQHSPYSLFTCLWQGLKIANPFSD